MKKPIKIKELNSQKKLDQLEKITKAKLQELEFSVDIQKTIEMVTTLFNKCDDLQQRDFKLHLDENIDMALFYMSGMTNETGIMDTILRPIALKGKTELTEDQQTKSVEYLLENHLLINHTMKKIDKFSDAIETILQGKALLLVDGYAFGYEVEVKEVPARAVTEPDTETLVRGPREGFVENIKINLGLVRKRVKTPDFKVEMMKVGHISQTDIAIGYIENIVDPAVVEEVKTRINNIDIDAIYDSGDLEQLIEDNAFSPFPQIGTTERPDKTASVLAGGRVVIFIDNSPFALIVPNVFVDSLQTSEDYYERFHFSTAVRILRYVSFVLALLGPSLYVAITTFHHEMIPTELLISIASARQGIPYPAIIEALLMETAFEALREAGLRLPKPVGQAVSIVGGLIIGEAAVQAGLVSQIMVIVVAGTGIASFTIPAFSMGITIRLLKIPILLISGTLGLFGVSIVVIAISIHLSTLRSFGVPYLSPIAPLNLKDQKDVIFRAPMWNMLERPTFIAKNNVVRMKVKKMKPQKPKQEEQDDSQNKQSS